MYKFIQISQENYPQLKELYFLCYNRQISKTSLLKKYDTSAFGSSHVGFIAISENDEISANYCVFPIILNYDSKDFLVAQSGDTMTSPKHQKRGLFSLLADKTYSYAQEQGIRLIFGFPNENSFPGFKNKLKWVFYGNMQRFLIKTNAFPLCELTSKLKFISPAYNYYVYKKLKKYKVEIESLDYSLFNYSKDRGMIKKDHIFFKYKQQEKNNYLIKINGFYIFLKTKSHLIIGDIGKIEKSEGARLISTLNQLANMLFCKRIILDVSKNHWLYDILIDYILPSDGLPIGFRLFNDDISFEHIQFIGADYDTF